MIVRTGKKGMSPIKAACKVFGVTKQEIKSNKWGGKITDARQCVIWAYKTIGFSTEEIAEELGVSVGTAKKNIYERLEVDKRFAEDFTKFKNNLSFY